MSKKDDQRTTGIPSGQKSPWDEVVQPDVGENVQIPPEVSQEAPPAAEPTPPEPPKDAPKLPTKVRARLGKDSPVGALVVAGVRLERDKVGLISAEDFKRLRKEYKLESTGFLENQSEVKG